MMKMPSLLNYEIGLFLLLHRTRNIKVDKVFITPLMADLWGLNSDKHLKRLSPILMWILFQFSHLLKL